MTHTPRAHGPLAHVFARHVQAEKLGLRIKAWHFTEDEWSAYLRLSPTTQHDASHYRFNGIPIRPRTYGGAL